MMLRNSSQSGRWIYILAFRTPVDLNSSRNGYPLAVLDRQLLLKILYTHLPDKSKILLGKRISKVDHSTEGIIAHCQDGSSYHGDIIAAVDGVHSTVRQEMWRHADQSISTKEKNSMPGH
jgi:2-polyprenyl-6-methoxyphenol hydroxylase-like FAD-dependent oxidoreductase